MASGKKNYFRHSMNARNDHKLRSFMDLFGRNWREGYFYFFTLLELCGNEAQEGKTEHTFHKKTLRDLWGTSAQGVHDVCTKCAQSALVMCKVDTDHVTFSLPNLLNYTGKYETNAPNKEKKIKENKENKLIIEPEKNLPEIKPQDFRNPKDLEEVSKKPSPLSFLFGNNPDIQIWLNEGLHQTHMMLLKKYSHHELVDLIEKAFAWAAPRGTKAESWLYTFVSNKNTAGYGLNQGKAAFKNKTNTVTATPKNPTANPYIQEAIDKGLIA